MSGSHTEQFEAFRARREAERAAQVRVTWRRVSADTGGGYSGLGPGGALVYVVQRGQHGAWSYGRVVEGRRVEEGTRGLLSDAKAAAEKLFRREET